MGQSYDRTIRCSCREEMPQETSICEGCGEAWCGSFNHFAAPARAIGTLQEDLCDERGANRFCSYSCKADYELDLLTGPFTPTQAIWAARASV